MKNKKTEKSKAPQVREKAVRYEPRRDEPMELREAAVAHGSVEEEPMVRTQIYLSRSEHNFLQSESSRLNRPMAAVIRTFIDEKMEVPEDAWSNNPLLEPTPDDPDWVGCEDGSLNHDHYAYGGPKQYAKAKGKWGLLPPLDE